MLFLCSIVGVYMLCCVNWWRIGGPMGKHVIQVDTALRRTTAMVNKSCYTKSHNNNFPRKHNLKRTITANVSSLSEAAPRTAGALASTTPSSEGAGLLLLIIIIIMIIVIIVRLVIITILTTSNNKHNTNNCINNNGGRGTGDRTKGWRGKGSNVKHPYPSPPSIFRKGTPNFNKGLKFC